MPDAPHPVMQMMHGALTLDLAFVGVSSGLLAALLEPATVVALAQRTGSDVGYTQRWCEAAFAFELLDREDHTYALSEKGRWFLPDAEPTFMPMAVQAVLSAHLADHAVTGLRTGARPGEVVLGERENVGRLFGVMLERAFGPLFEEHVLPAIASSALGRPGARVADLACGNGWILRRLARRYPGLEGFGLDGFAPNIHDAVARAEAEGVGDRLDFTVADVLDHHTRQPFDLVIMHRALHHVWDRQEAVMARLAEHVAPGGAVVIWEPRWPDDVEALRRPPLRGMAFQNLAEHVQGNHFLRPQEVADAMAAVGLVPEVHALLDGREMVVVGRASGR